MDRSTCNIIFRLLGQDELRHNLLVNTSVTNDTFMHNNSLVAHSSNHNCIATVKVDTRASRHYSKLSDLHVLTEVQPIVSSPSVLLPNRDSLQATKREIIPINNNLSLQAQQTFIFPGFENSSLLSIG